MSHATIYVLDQDQAKEFYVGKLMKVGSGSAFVQMKGGSAAKNDTKDLDAMAALLKKGMFNAGAFRTERSVLWRGSSV